MNLRPRVLAQFGGKNDVPDAEPVNASHLWIGKCVIKRRTEHSTEGAERETSEAYLLND